MLGTREKLTMFQQLPCREYFEMIKKERKKEGNKEEEKKGSTIYRVTMACLGRDIRMGMRVF